VLSNTTSLLLLHHLALLQETINSTSNSRSTDIRSSFHHTNSHNEVAALLEEVEVVTKVVAVTFMEMSLTTHNNPMQASQTKGLLKTMARQLATMDRTVNQTMALHILALKLLVLKGSKVLILPEVMEDPNGRMINTNSTAHSTMVHLNTINHQCMRHNLLHCSRRTTTQITPLKHTNHLSSHSMAHNNPHSKLTPPLMGTVCPRTSSPMADLHNSGMVPLNMAGLRSITIVVVVVLTMLVADMKLL
jgi:hypothetical protein